MRKIVIDSRVIKHLGRDLITSPEVAVIELVKNAIDAKAKVINLHVCNGVLPHGLPNISEIANIPADYLKRPLLLVEDDGTGMTDQAIDNGFLRIATNIKTNVKDALGQKGIGRLATQRLGSALLVETSSSSENHTSYVFIDWNEIINGVDEVPSFEAAATEHHTRLWVFGINLRCIFALCAGLQIQTRVTPKTGVGLLAKRKSLAFLRILVMERPAMHEMT